MIKIELTYNYTQDYVQNVSYTRLCTKYFIYKVIRSLLYDSIADHLSILRKKGSQKLSKNQKYHEMDCARRLKEQKIYILFEGIGLDKIKNIKSYSANSISKLTNDQIREII